MLKISKYLIEINRDEGILLYNSIFGRALLIDKRAYCILLKFKEGAQEEDILKEIMTEDKSIVENLIKIFKLRHFIVEEDTDERNLVHGFLEKRMKNITSGEYIRNLQLVVSNICNFNCEYCIIKDAYCSEKRYEIQNDPNNQVMKFEMAKSIIDTMVRICRDNNNRNIVIQFFGGEPLCNYKLIEQILDYYYMHPPKDVLILYSIVTNGSLLNEEIAKKFSEFNVSTFLSYDSVESSSRISSTVDNITSMIQDKINLLNKNNVEIVLTSTIAKNNLHEFNGRSLIEFAKKNNIRKVILSLDLNVDFYENKDDIEIMVKKTLETFYEGLSNKIGVTGKCLEIFKQIIGNRAINLQTGCKACLACGVKLSIEPNGDVFPCKISSSYCGNIKNVEEVLSSENFKKYTKNAYYVSKECTGCELEGFCSGLCNGGKEKKFNDIFVVNENSCDMFKFITNELLRNYPGKLIDSYKIN